MLELRPFQKEALQALERPGHVLCVAPTGSGKSLIYERAARRPGRRTLLITPLVALARQQHARLSATGPGSAATLGTALGAGRPSDGPPTEARTGVWIVSPEKLQSTSAKAALKAWRPDFLVVDECHCLWEWGERFRPAFNLVPRLLGELSIESSLWLTATLPPQARTELRQAVGPMIELGGFGLPPSLDLRAVRVPWADRSQALLGWILQQREPGIVFSPTRESTLRLCRLIAAAGRSAVPYHAGMSAEERRALEARIEVGLPDVIVATSAFGMGMDYPRLQWVALWQAPPSLLFLAQAIGRVGRDPSRDARALALWDDEDFRLLSWTVQGSERRRTQLIEVRRFFAEARCRKQALVDYFEGGRAGTGAEARGTDLAAAGGEAGAEADGTRAGWAEDGRATDAGAIGRATGAATAGRTAGAAPCGACDFCIARGLATGTGAGTCAGVEAGRR